MTVLDTSVVIDLLAGSGVAADVERLIEREEAAAAPDVVVLEVLAVLRREVRRGGVEPARAAAMVADLGDLAIEVFPSLPLRGRAWELRDNLTAADALFVALAELVDEPLATKDLALAAAAPRHAGIEVLELSAGP